MPRKARCPKCRKILLVSDAADAMAERPTPDAELVSYKRMVRCPHCKMVMKPIFLREKKQIMTIS